MSFPPFPHPMMGRSGALGGVTTWNPTGLVSTITLSNGNRRALENGSGIQNNVKSTTSKTSGKFYFEATKAGAVGYNTGGVPGVGLLAPGDGTNAVIASFTNGMEYLTYGTLSDNTGELFTGATDWSAVGSVACFAINFTTKLFWCRTGAAGLWNNSASANPVTGAGGYAITGTSWAIACDPYSTGQGFDLNCGQDIFVGAIPTGFTNWG